MLVILLGIWQAAAAAETVEAHLQQQFAERVQPFLAANCFECHDSEQREAELDLSRFATVADVTRDHRRWQQVLERLEAQEMPPEEASRQPTAEDRQDVINWVHALRTHVAERDAGDPGPVLARRLSNAEYNYTIRDLTGVDLRPTREFPVDPANEAGFDNSGESLVMSPALLQKYLAAAREIADHLVLKPEGFAFAPHPVLSETDRDKYCVLRIVDLYRRQPTDLAEYFYAAWQFKHRAALGRPDVTLADVAAEQRLSAKYLPMVWSILEETPDAAGPIARLQAHWRALPTPNSSGGASVAQDKQAVRESCVAMRDWVVQLRAKLQPHFSNLKLKAVGEGSQPFILWKNRQYATHRLTFDGDVLQVEGMPLPVRRKIGSHDDDDDEDADDEEVDERDPPKRDPELTVPANPSERARHEAGFERFCAVFPDVFYRSERGRMHFSPDKERRDKGRLLTAGFHNSTGYFRDDVPLYKLILDRAGQQELDALWRELDFIAFAPQRQHADFIFYERAEGPRTMKGPEFDFIRSEDKDAASEAKIARLAEVYLNNARESLRTNGGDPQSIPAIEHFFYNVNASIRWVEQARLAAEPNHVETLLDFADRAYCRPLSRAERSGLSDFYHSLRDDGMDHENAMRDAVVSVLMSPHFLFRMDQGEDGNGRRPLSGYELASRLSYFLWSSMPDARLRVLAASGELQGPDVLAAQARRMQQDERVRALAVEFGGNWLEVRRFEEHNAVDRERFPSFDNKLRQAMFEEPVRFFLDVVEKDRSVLEFLYAKHTFVNSALAKHYGFEGLNAAPGEWVRVDDASKYDRGGLLSMAVFLTKNAPGLRTSPVKRGYWVVRRLFGEAIPPPPAVVPELPHDEAQLGDLTLREVLERHRSDPSCAGCHARFDSFGLVFEGFGPIGERREKDLGGRPIDDHATFPDGTQGTGVAGLRDYIRGHREADFVDNLCRKMLAYALGRTLILSDEPLIEEMKTKLAEDGYRFGGLIESIVTSSQFRMKQSRDDLAQRGD